MTRRPAGPRAAFFILASSLALLPALGDAAPAPRPPRSEGDVVPLRSLIRPSAAPRVVSTGDSITVYSENLESFTSPGSEGGWTHVDKSGEPTAWHIATDFACEGNAFWCGITNPDWTGDPDRKGYDNGWTQEASNFVDLTGAASPVRIGFKHHLNVEPSFDFASIQVLDPDQGWVTLRRFTGAVDPPGAATCDTFSVQIPDSIIAKGSIVAFQFEFLSDVSGSSADGLYASADGWSIDNVTVLAGISDLRFFDDFESGIGTWSVTTFPPVGDLWRIVSNAASEQLCTTNASKVWTCGNANNGALVPRENDQLQSPRIAVTSADQVFLSFDVYRNLSLSACFYYRAEFRSRKTTDLDWSAWIDPSGLLYFGNEKEWLRQTIPLVGAGGADSVQFRLTARDFGDLYCDGSSTASGTLLLFDNFEIRIVGLAGPSITTTEADLFQDTFKTSSFFVNDNINTPKGDSLVVRVAASRGLKSATFYSSLNGAPFVGTPLTPTGGSAVNAYFADMPAGAYPRGTVVRYYLSATDSLDDVATLPADAVAASHYFSVSVLPAIQPASGLCPGDSARILYVNSEAPIDATPGVEKGLQAIGVRYDRYDVNAASLGLGNGPGGGNPLDPNRIWPAVPIAALSGYSTIVWDVGDRSDLTLSSEDQSLLQTWAGWGGRNRNLLMAGDNLAYDLQVNARGIPNFLACTLGSTYIRDVWESSPQDSFLPIMTGAPGTRLSPDPFPLNGGCPSINRFDALAPSTCGGGTGRAWILYPNQLASATERLAALGAPGGDSVRSVLAGFSFAAMGSAAQRNLFLWRTLHEEFEEPYCSTPTAVFESPDGAPRASARLLGAAPNPFNPRTTIRFELPRAARARLAIFDVRGGLVRVLVDGPQPAGHHEIAWDGLDGLGRAVATGTYFYRLETEGTSAARKLTLLR
ncbi:MAG TPA: FlgD immunoglobulin-like domain containing protein [Candidatus Eisenbacteria bacterium]|nr:FlgD immunoglobulin-like domain containing protein [Candidatus Eisenbacteria bacterium]